MELECLAALPALMSMCRPNISRTKRGGKNVSDKRCRISSGALRRNSSMTLKSFVKVV